MRTLNQALLRLLLPVVVIGALFSLPYQANAAFPGANGRIVFTSFNGSGKLWTMNPDGSNQTRVTGNGVNDFEGYGAWSPDGTKIVFLYAPNGDTHQEEIYTMNADGSGQTKVTNSGGVDSTPAWSPDGTKIAFTNYSEGFGEVYEVNADGTNQIRLTDNTATRSSPAWSPDGSKISFTFTDPNGGGIKLYVMNADGTNQTKIADTSGATDSHSAWSPDGNRIVFMGSNNGSAGIYTMNPDGSSQTQLTTGGQDPAWSPDGTKIIFTKFGQIYSMNADGSSQSAITNDSPAANANPDWQPLGQHNNPPTLSYSQTVGYANDAAGPGVEPNVGVSDQTDFVFRAVYTDADNLPPAEMTLILQTPSASPVGFVTYKEYPLFQGDPQDTNYVDGKEYNTHVHLPPGKYRYYFRTGIAGTDLVTTLPVAGDIQYVEADPPTEPAVSGMQCFLSTPSAKNLIFITHGWGDNADGWVHDMAESIITYISNSPSENKADWDVCTYDWREDAKRWNVGLGSLGFMPPTDAYVNAGLDGEKIGKTLAGFSFDSVHFIAHSAGSNLIQSAAEQVRIHSSSTKVHLTFLDAYDPLGAADSMYGVDFQSLTSSHVFHPDWQAEQYVDTRDPLPPILQDTNLIFPNTYNFDVTALDPNQGPTLFEQLDPLLIGYMGRVHAWPYVWYSQSISSPVKYGFPLSLESGNATFPPQYVPDGTLCTLSSNTTPCPTTPHAYPQLDLAYGPSLSVVGNVNDQSSTGNVTYPDQTSAIESTGSPVWFTFSATTTQQENILSFDYEFLSAQGAHGIISVFVDGNLVDKIDEQDASGGLNSENNIPTGELDIGGHTISFRLDPFTSVQSSAKISNIKFGSLVKQTISDAVAPTTTAIVSGTLWKNGWYLGTTTVNFTAQDNPGGVGVAKTEYSFDGGQTWTPYATSSPVVIATEGTSTIMYRSVDFLGNTEIVKSLSIKIVSVKWFLEDMLAKLKSIHTGNKNIDNGTTAIVKELMKDIADKSWLDRNRLSWPKGLLILISESGIVKSLGTQSIYRDAQNEAVQSTALLAKLSFDKAKTVKAKTTAGQKTLDRLIARIQTTQSRADANELKNPVLAEQLYGAAWFSSETLLKAAGATLIHASDLGELYDPGTMKDLVD